ncbi:hypothetical protein BXZ70DRAFT_1064348 [Cristinia sonorae]|uniref:F-box domain-containing protein n=1 Tax=Cristinia sonorae TaxID=1940300 RepID=A0A8K0UP50_9AGAR|nr:hypothetical protein BXZ70DRAFT_1064348 [Cristinia sonorae]
MNKVIPIARLPPEVLATIFSCYILSVDPGLTSADLLLSDPFCGNKNLIPYPWVHITHVCHDWREVALSTPSLWRTVYVGYGSCSVEATRTVLARSKHALLHLRIFVTQHPRWSTIILNTIQELSRAETFDLTTLSTFLDSHSVKIPPCAPHLRTLKIHLKSPLVLASAAQHMADFGPPNPPLLPAFLKTCRTPVLTQLSIIGYRIEWIPGTVPMSLTHLCISNAESVEDGVVKSACSDVAKVVACLHALQHLELLGTLEDLSDIIPPRPPPALKAPLPHLQTFNVSGNIRTCAHFLDHFILPLSTKISIEVRDVLNGVIANSPTISTISSVVHEISSDSTRRARLAVTPRSLAFYAASVDWPRMRIHTQYNIAGGESFLNKLCSALPLHCFSVLDLSYRHNTMSALTNLLGGLRNVETIRFNDVGAIDLITLLHGCPPSLKSVILYNIEFQDDYFDYEGDNWEGTLLSSLLRFFRGQEEAGCMVGCLTILDCPSVQQSDVELLRQSVKVIWD